MKDEIVTIEHTDEDAYQAWHCPDDGSELDNTEAVVGMRPMQCPECGAAFYAGTGIRVSKGR